MSREALSALDALVQSEKKQRAEERAAKERAQAAQRDMEEMQDLLALARSRRPYSCEERVSIPVVAGTCAGMLCGRQCAGMLAARATRLGVVVCHPFGPLGGSMYDPHVLAIVKSLRHVTTLRLNFRTGLDCGYSASNDVKAACKYLLHSIEKRIATYHSYSMVRTHAALCGLPCVPNARSRFPYGIFRLPASFLLARPRTYFPCFNVVFSCMVALLRQRPCHLDKATCRAVPVVFTSVPNTRYSLTNRVSALRGARSPSSQPRRRR